LAAYDNLARKLTVIPASTPEAVKVRVAAYCRVSTDSDDQLNSFAAQNTYYTTLFSAKENWIMVDIYADEGITGTSAEKREDFQRLMNDCRKGQIDKIYTKSISRFARNTKDCLEATRELKSMGIGVVFEEQHIDTSIVSGEMLTAIFASCAQAESESISKNVKWAIRKRMQNGSYISPCWPFGLARVARDPCIVTEEAVYVAEAYMRYLTGDSAMEIANDYKRRSQDEPVLRRRKWSFQLIIDMLQNEKYIGDSLWQKTYMTETLPRKLVRNKGDLDKYYVSNTHPAIIDQMVFLAVQELLKKRNTGRIKYANTSVIGKHLICGECGGIFRKKVIHGKQYRACCTHEQDRSICSITAIREEELYHAYFRLYYKLKNQGMEILAEMAEDLETVRERQMLWSPDIIEINKRISSITSQSHRLALLNKQGAVDSDIFISKSNQLAEQLRKAKREKEKLLQQQEDDTLRKTREIIDILDCGPDYLDSFDEELFRELIDKIIVESNERIRFRLKNGLELLEYIERTVR